MIPRIRFNVIANAVGRAASVVLAVAFTPLYIGILGMEAYGVIGFYITLQASISFLELGLSRACNREMARYLAEKENGVKPMRDTLRTLEVLYWLMAIVIGILLLSASTVIAQYWITSEQYAADEMTSVLMAMGLVIALRWPVGLYTGALMGMQKQVKLNIILVISSVLNWAGSALAITLISPTLDAFFLWQTAAAVVVVALFALITWKEMPKHEKASSFSIPIIKRIIPFSAGVGSNALLGVALRQTDKLILSALLPLKQFGYYALATVIANAVSLFAHPVSNAVFPRFTQLVSKNRDSTAISDLYHLACQVVSVIVIPMALVLAWFSYEVLFVYTGSAEIASSSSMILIVLVLARALRASMIVPYALQLAEGWVRLTLFINLASVVWLVPAVYFLAVYYGSLGAAIAWLVVTAGYVLVGMPLMHAKLLEGELSRWLWRAFFAPALSVSVFLFLVNSVFNELFLIDRWQQAAALLAIYFATVIIAILAARNVRGWVFSLLNARFSLKNNSAN